MIRNYNFLMKYYSENESNIADSDVIVDKIEEAYQIVKSEHVRE